MEQKLGKGKVLQLENRTKKITSKSKKKKNKNYEIHKS